MTKIVSHSANLGCGKINLFSTVKYIALLALVKIVPTHPYLVAEYQDMIMSSINDQDISIRMRALDLISAMVCLLRFVTELNAYGLFIGQSRQFAIYSSAAAISLGPQRDDAATFCCSVLNTAYFCTGVDKAGECAFSKSGVSSHSIAAHPRVVLARNVRERLRL